MSIRAEADKKFLMKFLLIAIACIAFGLWSVYDGMVGYPKKLPRARAYAELSELDETERTKQWQVIAKDNDWSHGKPDTPEEIEAKIVWQWGMAAVCALIGLPLLLWYFKTKGSWLELDGESLRSSWGADHDLSNVVSLDKRKWDTKGIAKVEFDQAGGRSTFKLDDFMYSREPMGEILEAIESKISPEKIIGANPPEATAQSDESNELNA